MRLDSYVAVQKYVNQSTKIFSGNVREVNSHPGNQVYIVKTLDIYSGGA
jgi:hypothetical protein